MKKKKAVQCFSFLHLFESVSPYECAVDEKKKKTEKRRMCALGAWLAYTSIAACCWVNFVLISRNCAETVWFSSKAKNSYFSVVSSSSSGDNDEFRTQPAYVNVSMTMRMENGLLFSIGICVNEFMHKLRPNLLRSIQRRTLLARAEFYFRFADIENPFAYHCEREQTTSMIAEGRQLIQLIAPSSDSTP